MRGLDVDCPVVTIVVPMRNELGWIGACLEAFSRPDVAAARCWTW